MPSCVALMAESRLRINCRAIFARRCPLTTRVSSWVSRILTTASSAATKKPLSTTNAPTASSLSRSELTVSLCILQIHLPENEFENVVQTDQAQFALIAAEDDAKALTAAL